ncbi:unnamed protein product [Prunus brigantina]
MEHIKQVKASKSGALFQDAKSKLQEIRAQHSKRLETKTDLREENGRKRRRKNKNSSDVHVRLFDK